MIRVLQIADNMDLGGIQAFIMNTYKALIPFGIQFDFLVFHDRKQLYEDEIYSLGGKMYKLPSRREGMFKCRRAIREFFRDHSEYRVVHYQTSSLSFLDPLTIAAEFGIPVRIIHSHSTNTQGSRIHHYLHLFHKRYLKNAANYFFSCGNLAAKWMFDGTGCEKQVILINNGIDLDKYSFNEEKREQERNILGIDENYVIGIVGRLSEVKNHKFLFNVLKEIINSGKKDNAIVLAVGDGELRTELKEYTKELDIEDKVIFLGTRNDVQDLLQAMDVLAMPSLYEGFPVTAIEAQASGLPCVLSADITEDAKIKDNVTMLSLEAPISEWVEYLCKEQMRLVDNQELVKSGFAIQDTINQLISVYQKGNNG